MRQGNIIGVDLAKNSFSVCVMNEHGRVIKRYNLVSRKKLLSVLRAHSGVIVMEACGGAHYWARELQLLGRETRIIAGQFVKPFVKSNKNDEIDAEAICEAASRDQMRYVGTKSEEQQDIQGVHRVRERLTKQRTALSNQIRGLLLEYGITIPQGISYVRKRLMSIIEEHELEHSALWKATFLDLYEEFQDIDERLAKIDDRIKALARGNETCQRLMKIPGVAEITATALYAAVGTGEQFKNGRQLAAWLGVTPRQHSTGGKELLLGISKRGNTQLRTLLIQGARSVAIAAERKRDSAEPHKRSLNRTQRWLFEVGERRGGNRAVVALANKMARICCKVLQGAEYKTQEELIPLAA